VTKVGSQWRFDEALIKNWLLHYSTEVKYTILVIDDDESICFLLKNMLEDGGHIVTTVSESLIGIELVKNRDYDFVFLDLKMPGMDAAELFKQLRANKPKLPVAIITGYPDSDLMTEALAYGPFCIMKKPFTEADIMSGINNYLRFGSERSKSQRERR